MTLSPVPGRFADRRAASRSLDEAQRRWSVVRRAVMTVAVAVVMLVGTPAPSLAAEPAVTVLGPTVFALPGTATSPAVFSVQALLGVSPSAVSVSVVAIASDAGPQPVVKWSVTVAPPRAGNKIGALLVRGPAGALPEQGTYSLSLLVVAGSVQQPFTITAVRRPVSVTVPSGQDTDVSVGAPLRSGHGKLGSVDVELDPATGLQTVQVSRASVDGGSITLLPPKNLQSAGGLLTFEVHGVGQLSPGDHSVVVSLRSPQLAAPVSVPLHIVVRVNRLWIALLAAVGVLAGWLVRVLVVSWRQRAAADRRAATLLASASALRTQYPDPEFVAAIGPVVDALTGLANEKDLTRLQSVLDAQDVAIKTAQSSYEQHRVEALAGLQRLTSASGYEGVVPATFRAVLDSAETRRATADADLAARKPTNAMAAVTSALIDLRRDLTASTAAWRTDVRSSFQSLASDAPEPISGMASKMLDRLDQYPLQTGEASSPVDLLRAISQVTVAEQDLLAATAAVAEHARVASADLSQADHPEAAGALNRLADALSDTAANLAAVTAAFVTFNADAERDIVAAAREGNPDDAEQVAEALAAGAYSRAAALLITARPRNNFRVDLASEAAIAGTDTTNDQRQPALPGANYGTAGPAVSPNIGAMPVPAAIASLRLRGRRALFGARLLDTVISAVVAVAVAYLIFGDTWFGTGHDIVQVFLWGFAVNLSAEGVSKLAEAAAPTTAT